MVVIYGRPYPAGRLLVILTGGGGSLELFLCGALRGGGA